MPKGRRSSPAGALKRLGLVVFILAAAQTGVALAVLVPPWAAEGLSVRTTADGRVEVAGPTGAFAFLPGVGWHPFLAAPAPRLVDGSMLIPREIVVATGAAPLDLPIVVALRGADRQGSLRVVLDLDRPHRAPSDIESETGKISVPIGGVLVKASALTPLSTGAGTARIGMSDGQVVVRIEIVRGGSVVASSLTGPDRVVLDAYPRLAVRPVEDQREVAPGIYYWRFGINTAVGEAQAHAVVVRPGAARFQVVTAALGTGARLAELAGGAIAAINGGYFDTRTFHPVGLLVSQGEVLGTGFLGRGAVGFTPLGGVVIGRPRLALSVHSSGAVVPVAINSPAAEVALHNRAGTVAGRAGEAAVVAIAGRVVARLPAPASVPNLGFVVTYPLDQIPTQPITVPPGALLRLELNWTPASWSPVSDALEAGPVLVAEGLNALDFAAEAFRADADVAVARTSQSGIGVLADGSTLLVVTERTTTRELRDIFLALGAVQALRLDGGSSTGLMVEGRLVGRGGERRIASAILVLPSTADFPASEKPGAIEP